MLDDIRYEPMRTAIMRLTTKSILKPFAYAFMKYPTEFGKVPSSIACIYAPKDALGKITYRFDVEGFEKENLNARQTLFIILHEISHVIYFHTWRHHKEIPEEIMALATDHVINLPLKKSARDSEYAIETPKSAFLVPELEEDEETHNWSAEQVAKFIMDNYEFQTKTYTLSDPPCN